MRRLTISSSAFLILSLSFAPLASAKREGKGPPSFDSLDRDQNQQLSKEELTQATRMSAAFATIDTDNNGTISKDEFETYRAAHSQQVNKN